MNNKEKCEQKLTACVRLYNFVLLALQEKACKYVNRRGLVG